MREVYDFSLNNNLRQTQIFAFNRSCISSILSYSLQKKSLGTSIENTQKLTQPFFTLGGPAKLMYLLSFYLLPEGKTYENTIHKHFFPRNSVKSDLFCNSNANRLGRFLMVWINNDDSTFEQIFEGSDN